MQINKERVKKTFKDKLITALTIAPSLAVMLLSAVYNLAVESMGMNIDSAVPIMMSCLTLFTALASTVLAVVYKRRFTTVFFAVIFMLCFLCYLGFYGSGTTDIYADAFFEMFMLILSVPVWSYMPLAMRIAPNQGMMALFITAILVLINTAVSIWLTVSEKRGKKLE